MKTQYLLLLLAVCLSSVASKSGGDPIELKFNMPAGMIFTTTIQTVSQIQMGGGKLEKSQEIEYSMTSLGVNDGLTNVNTMVQAKKVSAPFLNEFYDSRGDNSGEADEVIGNMFTIIMDKQARVKEINGFEEAFAGDTFNIKASIGQCMAELPAQPVALGDSWESERFVNNDGMNFHFMNKWTLDNVREGVAYISLKSTYINANYEVDTNGAVWAVSQSGNFAVDVATGITLKSYFILEANVTANDQKMGTKTIVLLETR